MRRQTKAPKRTRISVPGGNGSGGACARRGPGPLHGAQVRVGGAWPGGAQTIGDSFHGDEQAPGQTSRSPAGSTPGPLRFVSAPECLRELGLRQVGARPAASGEAIGAGLGKDAGDLCPDQAHSCVSTGTVGKHFTRRGETLCRVFF